MLYILTKLVYENNLFEGFDFIIPTLSQTHIIVYVVLTKLTNQLNIGSRMCF
jgi:hypothetical protein